eukprot:TRINITY_DN17867_c0_g2_i1.p2 TRINITY_DN17867_c0_g2~~TRINITY_DN17867_c0_g2_i1.p2  ORF type:complete len:262 (+),score=66.12 TRINITY_DN17867_c0_g2_i1:103-888(+)
MSTTASKNEWRRHLAPYSSEFVGTFFLACTVGLTQAQNQALAPIAVGFVLTALHVSSGAVSGGHFNPAVTIGVWLSGRDLVPLDRALKYIVAQALGALMAASACWGLLSALDVPKPAAGVTQQEAIVSEVVFSAAWVFVALSTATLAKDTKEPFQADFAGLAIGLTVAAAAFANGGLGSCCLNPAMALAFFGFAGSGSAGSMVLYSMCPLLGAAVAAALFRAVRTQEFAPAVLKCERERREGNISTSRSVRGGGGYGSFSP